jgi:Tfp pilus assembly protein PilN
MRALQLDYRDNHGLRNLIGYMLLALVLALALSIGWYFTGLRQQISQVQASLDEIDSRIHAKTSQSDSSTMPPQKLADVIKFSNRTIHQLNLPWSFLFSQLEKAKTEGVALLSVEPNANSTSIKVVGEANSYEAMLKYVRNLSAQGVLQGVYLMDHKMDEQNPDKPIRFSLEASWLSS